MQNDGCNIEHRPYYGWRNIEFITIKVAASLPGSSFYVKVRSVE